MSGKRILNILTGDYVITSPADRIKRPWHGAMSRGNGDSVDGAPDPLAPGAVRANGEQIPHFTGTYLFRSDFPVFNNSEVEENLPEPDDLFVVKSCKGVSHVLVYSPDYDKHFSQMSSDELAAVFESRCQFFADNKRDFEYIQIYETKGAEAGASPLHPHCQIWSTQFLPTIVEKMQKNQEAYFNKHQSPMLSDYLSKELEKNERIVAELEHFVILIPFWACWPYEIMILPRRRFHSIDQMTADESADFMHAIQKACRKYVTLFETPQIPFIMGLRNAPSGSYLNTDLNHWIFHAVFYPSLPRKGRKWFLAGYELLAEMQRDFDTSIAVQKLCDAGE